MSFKKIFLIFSKNEHEIEWKKKIASLELDLKNLKKTMADLEEKTSEVSHHKQKDPPIIIEKINIEKIVLDKYELNNNFGQLGIKELKGKLNIGATYGTDFTPMPSEEEGFERNVEEERVKREQSKEGPRVNIKSKHED